MKILPRSIFVLLLCFCGFTVAQKSIDSLQLVSKKELKSEFPKNIAVKWHDKDATPEIITFTKPYKFDNNPLKSAEKFLKKMSHIFKKQEKSDDLELIRANKREGITHYRFKQRYKDIPVVGGEIMVSVFDDGRVQTALGSYKKDIDLDIKPVINANEAFNIAMENPSEITLKDSLISSELLILPKDNLYFLVWKLEIPNAKGSVINYYYVDAVLGSILRTETSAESFTMLPQSMANYYPRHPGLDYNYSTISPINDNGSGFLQGTYVNVLNWVTSRAYETDFDFAYSTSSTHFDEANLFYHIDKFRRNFWNALGFDEFTQITAYANYTVDQPDAYFDREDQKLYFGNGEGYLGFNSFAREDKVIYHEYTHAVTYSIIALDRYDIETESINEGNSDYFAATFTNRTEIGDYCVPIDYRRDLSDPDYDTYQQFYNDVNRNKYTGATFWSATLWDLRTELGSYYTDRLVHNALYGIPTTCTFQQYRQKILDYDNNNYSGNHVEEIISVFYEHGIGTANIDLEVTGPSYLDFKDVGTYTAVITGGSGDFTYSWYRSTDGGSTWILLAATTNSITTTMTYSDITIRCDVHDDVTGEEQSDTKTIYYGTPLPKDKAENLEDDLLPKEYSLGSYPNPFNPATNITYALPEKSIVQLKVFDLLGNEVCEIVNSVKGAGIYQVSFDGSNLASGVYILNLQTKAKVISEKIMLMK